MSMSTFNKAPLEILVAIFKELPRHTLNECQFVSRSWHEAAHRLLIEDARLLNNSQAYKFLEYISSHPSYKNVIKKLTLLGDLYNSGRRKGEYVELDSNLCQMILDNCPQIEKVIFSCSTPPPDYYKLLEDLRNTLTSVKIDYRQRKEYFGELIVYLAQFPKLASLTISSTNLNMEDLSSLLLKVPHLKKLNASISDIEDDADKIIQAKPLEEQKLIVERLAQLDNLITRQPNFGAMGFIKKHFTGLKRIQLLSDRFTPPAGERSLTSITEFVCSIPEHQLRVERIGKNAIYEQLPKIMQTVYSADEEKAHKVLHVSVETTIDVSRQRQPFDLITSSEKQGNRLIRTVGLDLALIFLLHDVNLDDILALDLQLQDVATLKFRISDFRNALPMFSFFEKFLLKMPNVTKLTLNIPSHIYEMCRSNQRFTAITDLEIVSKHAPMDKEEDYVSVISLFPNTRRLKLTTFHGVHNEQKCSEYNVFLNTSELDNLSINARCLKYDSTVFISECDYYFLLAVEIEKKKGKHFYKVWNDYLRLEEIKEYQFQESNVSKMYVKVKDLRYLTIVRTKELSRDVKDLIETRIDFK